MSPGELRQRHAKKDPGRENVYSFYRTARSCFCDVAHEANPFGGVSDAGRLTCSLIWVALGRRVVEELKLGDGSTVLQVG